MIDFSKVPGITNNGSVPREPTAQDRHYLLGYRWNTLLSYNAAIKKYQAFAKETGRIPYTLPLKPKDIYDFCHWAGRTADAPTSHDVAAVTLRKYLAGIQMWHTYHDTPFPEQTKQKVATMLKSSTYADLDTPRKPRKKAVTVGIMVKLAELLGPGDPFQKALLDLAIVAFWGMARLVELTYNNSKGLLRRQASLLTSDVQFDQDLEGSKVSLIIRGAKTADPGEEQVIHLHQLPHMLCPILAIRRRLAEAEQFISTNGETSLFGFTEADGSRTHLTKPMATRALDKIWKAQNLEGVSGHSFRVGGASVQKAFGVSDEQICLRGRWNSDCYKLYLREFPPEELEATYTLLNRLEECWTLSTLKGS
ncbi:uncharacterized protein PGTG_22536 [Puccinia graminis f. sp. tritici CRL 75-36-700-3]|uniref:Tyr recombinase domain-containing protein n=1 Tax=Puccinia graminis f. sp. tritici (strain CRL 75-36-700-3 / race SCCL) TaxID=418459 RepID=H6QUW5_PUCGT|nr:uncharacterized protein PGTG_22536 [Puccinia graminis f. sp. tritici CRL 75-36-700-3]EHS64873.1 hypothetical protein PGTG_22536 [Puccinia graminis f. sp. tritici CRL 75-36-700-3]